MKEPYKTKDLAEASALLVMKKTLLKVEREGQICWFVFDDKKNCEKISNNFFFGQLPVNAREYYEAMNRLKNKIFSM